VDVFVEARMQAEKRVTLNIAFVLSKRDLTKLNEIIRDYLGSNATVTFRGTCGENTTLTWDSIGPLQDYTNPRKKSIRKLVISGSSENFKKRVSVVLGRMFPLDRNLQIEVSGDGVPQPTVENTFQSLEETCEGMMPWYSWVATVSLLMSFSVLSGLATVILIIMHTAKGGIISQLFQTGGSGLVGLFWYMTTVFAGIGLLHIGRSYVFPLSSFTIGQGEKRHSNGELLRLSVIAAFFVNVIAGIVVGLIFL
jgi:hypothetical protein